MLTAQWGRTSQTPVLPRSLRRFGELRSLCESACPLCSSAPPGRPVILLKQSWGASPASHFTTWVPWGSERLLHLLPQCRTVCSLRASCAQRDREEEDAGAQLGLSRDQCNVTGWMAVGVVGPTAQCRRQAAFPLEQHQPRSLLPFPPVHTHRDRSQQPWGRWFLNAVTNKK